MLAPKGLKIKVTLRLAVYRPSVRLGATSLEIHDQRFLIHFVYITYYSSFFPFHYTQVLCQYRPYRADHAYLILCYKSNLVFLKSHKLDHCQV
jgi:hypothetical protein